MKITLSNFRCHHSLTINIADNGMTLLSGASGVGKSTILEGICFALYGELKKPYSFDKKSCRVELLNETMKIVRSKTPNSLTITIDGKTFHDDTAQAMINKNIGMNYDEFMASSYIKQRLDSSILYLSPLEQLKFFEKISFDNDLHSVLKEKIKNVISETNKKITTLKEAENINSIEYARAVKEMEKVHAPSPNIYNTENECTENIVKMEAKKIVLTKSLADLGNEKKSLYEKIQKIRQHEKKLNDLKNRIRTAESIISNLEQTKKTIPQISKEDITIEQQKLELKKLALKDIMTLKELIRDRDNFASILEKNSQVQPQSLPPDTLIKLATELKSILEYLAKLKKYEESEARFDSIIRELSEKFPQLVSKYKRRSATLTFLQDRLVESEKNVSEEIVYSCPCCKQHLVVKEGVLCTTDKTETIEIVDKNMVSALKMQVPILAELILNKRPLKPNCAGVDIMERKAKLEKIVSESQRQESGVMISSIREKISAIDVKIKAMGSIDINNESLLLNEIKNIEIDIVNKWKLISERSSINLDLQSKKQEKNTLISQLDSLGYEGENADEKYEQIECAIVSETAELTECNNNIQKSIMAMAYFKALNNVERWNASLVECKTQMELTTARNLYANIIKEKIQQAEIITIEGTINTLNSHAKEFLEQMFEEDIVVAIQTIKEMKKSEKISLNTKICYKGSNYDNINQLSGGERERVSLAFILAANKIMNSNILMLDESLASLDASTNTELFHLLKQFSRNKLVLVVSHEANRGIFDVVHAIE